MSPCRVGPQTGAFMTYPYEMGPTTQNSASTSSIFLAQANASELRDLKGCEFYALIIDLPPHARFRPSPVSTRKVDSHKPRGLRGTQG
jgi:hypothetical protein